MSRPRLLVLVGIPGAGKTTYAARLHTYDPSMQVISPDIIREQLYPGYDEGRVDVRCIDDRRVFRAAYRTTAEALQHGHDVIFDATSLTFTRRKKLIDIARRYDAEVIAHFFPISLDAALQRNRRRLRQVPPGAIAHMARVLVPPQMAEGFDRITVHRTARGLHER